jgi:hypothetical protein
MVETMGPGSPADAAFYGARKTPRSSKAPAAVEVRVRAERRGVAVFEFREPMLASGPALGAASPPSAPAPRR